LQKCYIIDKNRTVKIILRRILKMISAKDNPSFLNSFLEYLGRYFE